MLAALLPTRISPLTLLRLESPSEKMSAPRSLLPCRANEKLVLAQLQVLIDRRQQIIER